MTRRRQRRVRILANRERRLDATHQPWANFNANALLGKRGRAHRLQRRYWASKVSEDLYWFTTVGFWRQTADGYEHVVPVEIALTTPMYSAIMTGIIE